VLVIENIAKAANLLTRRQRLRWLLLVPLGLVTASIEAAAAATVYGLVSVINGGAVVQDLPVMSGVYDYLPAAWQAEPAAVRVFLILTGLLFLLKALVFVVLLLFDNRILERDKSSLAIKVYDHYLNAPTAFHLHHNTADCIHRINESIITVFGVLTHLKRLAEGLMVVTGILAAMLIANPSVTVLATLLIVGWITALLYITRRMFRQWGARMDQVGKERLQGVHDGLRAITEVKLLGREQFFHDRFAASERTLIRLRYLTAAAEGLPRVVIESVFILTMIVALFVLLGPTGHGAVDLPLLGLYAYAGLRTVPIGIQVVNSVNRIRSMTAPIDRLLADLASTANEGWDTGSDGDLPLLRKEISLSGVSFSYGASSEPVLSEIDLSIERGEWVGITGATGAGKSTLVQLIAGLGSPTQGTLTVDGLNVRGRERAWHRQVGFVPQMGTLLDESIRRNIALGLEDEQIDEDRIREVLRLVRLEELLGSLADGVDTKIGERGVRLSGGERQRVAIARALYNDPQVLLLDEATSALDTHSEGDVLESIQSHYGDRTLVMITHRMTTLSRCDRLVVMGQGRIHAVGSYEGLVEESDLFRQMAAPPPLKTG